MVLGVRFWIEEAAPGVSESCIAPQSPQRRGTEARPRSGHAAHLTAGDNRSIAEEKVPSFGAAKTRPPVDSHTVSRIMVQKIGRINLG